LSVASGTGPCSAIPGSAGARIIVDIEAENSLGTYESRARYISRRLLLSRTAPLAIEIGLDGFFDAHYNDTTCDCHDSDFTYEGYDHYCVNTFKFFDQARRLIRLAVGHAGEHMARWASLSIDFSMRCLGYLEDEPRSMRLLADLKHPTPNLTVLSLKGIDGSFEFLLPALSSLTRYECGFNGRIRHLNMPWSSLRSLEFSWLGSPDCGDLLYIPTCTRLDSLCIRYFVPLRPETLESLKHSNPFKCTLPFLTSLELLYIIPLDMTSFNLPSLINLTLAAPESFKDPQEKSWEATMCRVGQISTLAANVRRLNLLHRVTKTRDYTEFQAPQVRLVEMLSYMPKLEEIHLPSTLYLCVRNTLREDLDVVPHLERIFIVPEKGYPILIDGKNHMPRSGNANWRVSIPLLLPGKFRSSARIRLDWLIPRI